MNSITFKEWLQFTVNEIVESYAERFPECATMVEMGGVCFMQEFRMQELLYSNMLKAFDVAAQKVKERGNIGKPSSEYTYSDWAKEICYRMQTVMRTIYELE